MYYWSPRRRVREKRGEIVFKEIMAENLPDMRIDLDIKLIKYNCPQIQFKEISKTSYSNIVKNQRRKENTKSSKRNKACHLKMNAHRFPKIHRYNFLVQILKAVRE